MTHRLTTLEEELETAMNERTQYRKMLLSQYAELDTLRLETDALQEKLAEGKTRLDAQEVTIEAA